MNISLLFPPSWHPSQPYLSIPCLSAFLENSGVPVQQQRDLNIELLDRMLTKSFGLDIHQQLIDLVRKLKWRDKQKVTIRKKGRTLIIQDWQK